MRDAAGSSMAGETQAVPGWHRWAVPALLVVHGLACWLARPIGYLTGQDDIEYLVLGQSIRHGGYNLLFRVDQPLHAQYPPGYPAMLAIWGAVTGDGFSALAFLNVLFSVATLAIAYFAGRKVFGATVALLALMAITVNPELVAAGGNIASETPFTLLSILALALLMGESPSRRRIGWAMALAILATLTRSVGVVLIAAVGLHLVLERRWKAAGVFAVASLLFVGSWFLWTAMAPGQYLGSSYVADLQAAVRRSVTSPTSGNRLVRQITYYGGDGLPYAMGVPTMAGTPIDNLVAAFVTVTGLLAGWWVLFRRWRPAALYLGFYGVLLLMWAYRQPRFLIPLVPLLVLALVGGLHGLLRSRWPRVALVTAGLAAVLLVAGGGTRVAAAAREHWRCRDWQEIPPADCLTPAQAGFFEAVGYIRAEIPPGDVFLVSKPGALWYYTGHPSISFPEAFAQGQDGWVPYLRGQGVKWILVTDLLSAELVRYRRRLGENCEAVALERRFDDMTWLFRLTSDEPGEEGTGRTDERCRAVQQFLQATDRGR